MDDNTGLQVRCVAVEYHDFPAVEWDGLFQERRHRQHADPGGHPGVGCAFRTRGTDGEFVLHGIKGDFERAESFEPWRQTLAPEAVAAFAPPGSGKSSDGPKGWPYFNLQTPGGGIILAVGWPGQWAASFTRDAGTGADRTGWPAAHPPAPQARRRDPYTADRVAAVLERQAMSSSRRISGGAGIALTTCRGLAGNRNRLSPRSKWAVRKRILPTSRSLLDAGIQVDLCWRDAGGTREGVWFKVGPDPLPFQHPGMIWLNSGTWEIDPVKYPNGFKPFTDWIHARGMQFVLWFEPERVGDPNSWLGKNHPEWLLPGTSHGALLDEGNPDARCWLTDHISGMIEIPGDRLVPRGHERRRALPGPGGKTTRRIARG